MAGNSEGQAPDQGGGAVDGLTPPTMKYGGSEQTQIGSANTLPGAGQQNTIQATPNTIQGGAPGSGAPATYAQKSRANSISSELGPDTTTVGVTIQDLSNEKLLASAPRKESHGRQCPALNDIPLLAKIGQGGMGAVYYGIHPRLRSEVAVKVLPFHLAEQDPGMIRRFFREAQIAAQVRSPHLVNVMDVNEEAGLFFLVMEYVPGCTAGQYLKALIEKTQAGMPEKDVLDLTIAATEGLWAAHSSGVVHRDIKPENIMIPYQSKASKEYDLRRAKLMDLGLARNEESNQSLTGAQAAMGTPGYMAPEQAMDAKTADKRSDVFSMGATIYALLTGRPPFKGETIMKVLMATMHEPHEPVIKHRPDVSPILNDILERSLSKKQEGRFTDAKQLLTALEDCRRLIGDGGSGALSGVKTYVYQGGGNTPPSSQATLMNANQTIAGGAVPQKSKGGMLIAAGVAVVVLGGAAMFLTRGKTDPGTVVVDPDKNNGIKDPGPAKPPSKFTPEELAALRTGFKAFIDPALKAAEAGDKVTAGVYLKMAQGQPVATEPEFKAEIDKIVSAMDKLDKKEKFQKSINEVDALLLAGKTDDALKVLLTSRANAIDKELQEQADKRQKKIVDLKTEQAKKSSFISLTEKAAKLKTDKKIDEALEAIGEALKLYPEEIDAIKLNRELAEMKQERDKNLKYEELDKAVKTAFDAGDYNLANKTAYEMTSLIPARPEGAGWIQKIEPKLGEAQRLAQLEERKRLTDKKFDDAMAAYNQQVNESKYEDAAKSLKIALEAKPDNATALEFKRKVDLKLEEISKKQADERTRREFDGLLTTASEILKTGGDLKLAEAKIAEAEKLFPNDQVATAAVQKAKEQVSVKRAEMQKKDEFDKLVSESGNLLEVGKLEDAEKSIVKALALFPQDKLALSRQTAIKDASAQKKLLEAQAAEVTRQKIDSKISSADGLAQRGDFAGAMKALNEATSISASDSKLKAKITEVQKLQKDFDEYAGAALGLVQSKLQKSALADALKDADAAKTKYPSRFGVITEKLQLSQSAVSEINGKLATLDGKAAGKTSEGRTRAMRARDAILQQTSDAVSKLTLANLADASTTLSRLDADVRSQLAEANRGLDQYSSDIQPKVVTPPKQPAHDNNPYEEKKTSTTKPKEKPPTVKPVGDSNPFD